MKAAMAEQQKRSEMQETMEAAAKGLKQAGKDFTVDSIGGRVIQIKNVDVKRLPNRGIDVRVRVEGDDDGADEPPSEAPRKKSQYTHFKKDKPKKKREPKIPPGTFLQPEDHLGPMVEDMHPAGGVTLREGDSIKRSDLKTPKDRPSKAEFKRDMDAMGFNQQFQQAQEELKKYTAEELAGKKAAVPPPPKSTPAPEKKASREREPEQYKPQAVAPLPMRGPEHGARSRRTGKATDSAADRKHWTAASFEAAQGPATGQGGLPGLQQSINSKLAHDFAHSIQAD
jgi:hypothetical protein